MSLRDEADARFYFITAPWEAPPLPQHTALCVQVRTLHFLLVRLPSDWISPFRKRENGSHTLANTLAGRSPVWERPSQPPSRWLWISWVWKPVQPQLEQTWKDGQNLLEWHHLAAEDLLFSPGWHCRAVFKILCVFSIDWQKYIYTRGLQSWVVRKVFKPGKFCIVRTQDAFAIVWGFF